MIGNELNKEYATIKLEGQDIATLKSLTGELENKKQLLGLLSDVDVLLLNKKESASLVPGNLLEELLSKLKNYTKTVIITNGAMGGIATNGEKTYRFGIYEDVKIVDTTGAGDAFGSGFLQPFQVTGETVLPVFHEYQGAVHPGNFVEAQILEEFGGVYLGIQEQVHIGHCSCCKSSSVSLQV